MRKTDMVAWDPLVALALLTRLPLPKLPDRAFDHQARATWAFPLVGLVVGTLAALPGLAAYSLGLPPVAAAGLVLVTQIMITGAMHEDGLADTADGFWGGWTWDRRLEIMKDSVIGTYGVLALILAIGLRWSALASLDPGLLVPALVAADTLSRAVLPVMMTCLPNARDGGLSASVGRPSGSVSAVALGLGVGVLGLMVGAAFWLSLIAALLGALSIAVLAQGRIGGQTGDVLGATQQIAQILVVLGVLATL